MIESHLRDNTDRDTRISVVIPCFNGAAYLRETLNSVLAQTHCPCEILVVDDGSTDDSATIAESFGPSVRVIRQSNQGESVARNRGIDETCSEWIAFLDADDVWLPTKLQQQVKVIEPGVVCVHTNIFKFGAQDKIVDLSAVPAETRYSAAWIACGGALQPSTLLVRKESSPRFPTWTRFAEDMIYNLELVSKGECRLVTEPLTGYRIHERSQSALVDVETRWHETITKWLEGNPPGIDPVTRDLIQRKWIERIVQAATRAKCRREWPRFWALRDHLRKCEHFGIAEGLLTERIYPGWLYAVADFLRPPQERHTSAITT